MTEQKLSSFLAEHRASEFGLAPVSRQLAIQMAEALETKVEEMESAGHSMDCDVRKDSNPSVPPVDCSCGWTDRLSALPVSSEQASE